MTVEEAIKRADALKENDYTEDEKINWINQLESRIIHEIIYTHVRHFTAPSNVIIKEDENGGCTISFDGSATANLNGVLYADIPYSESDKKRQLIMPHLMRLIDIQLEKLNAQFEYDDLWTEEALAQIYVDYLLMQIDYYNGETDRHNNSASRFNTRWQEIKNYYTHCVKHSPTPNFCGY